MNVLCMRGSNKECNDANQQQRETSQIDLEGVIATTHLDKKVSGLEAVLAVVGEGDVAVADQLFSVLLFFVTNSLPVGKVVPAG